MFQAHGIPSETDEVAWYSLALPPPFHGNLVVPAKDAGQADLQARLRRIEASRLPDNGLGLGLGMKESYANLDPAALGLQAGFSASWL